MIRFIILGSAWLASILGVWYAGYVLGHADGSKASQNWCHDSLYGGDLR